ncbi:hypothetical protein NC652_005714 [Populus alba x Populus x berolinensis]|nr:hypothetical protein NC652_005714 [Populus alba x Populus x berolinensis]
MGAQTEVEENVYATGYLALRSISQWALTMPMVVLVQINVKIRPPTNISHHRTVWGKRLAGSRKYRRGYRVPWFGQRKIPASDKFNHHLLAAVCGGSSQPFQKQQLLRAGTPRHYLARGLAMLA